jgi:hypothetical protein
MVIVHCVGCGRIATRTFTLSGTVPWLPHAVSRAHRIQAELYHALSYSIIRNCNYDRDSIIMLATEAVRAGWTDDADEAEVETLIEALDDLEEVLAADASDPSPAADARCQAAEAAVEAAWTPHIRDAVDAERIRLYLD